MFPYRETLLEDFFAITYSGPAIWGGCVTRPVLTEATGERQGYKFDREP